MAEDKSKSKPAKKAETLRQRTQRASEAPRVRRIQKTAKSITKPFSAAKRVGAKEYYLPLPDNKVGHFLNKRRQVTPRYFRDAWAEVRNVQWPDRRTTVRLTFAVFVFSLVFGLLITTVDYGLDKLFRKVFLS
jgi:preprotein translocase SecE subunit